MRRFIPSVILLLCIAPIALGAAPAKPKTPPKPVQKTPATKSVSGVNSPNSKAKLNLELTDKTKFTIDDAKGKIVLLYFWMSSAESTSEFSKLLELQAKHADGGLLLIGINGDRDLATMQATVKEKHISWPQSWNGFWRQNPVFKDWGVMRLPWCAVIGPDSTVLFIGPGTRASEEVEKAFAQHPPQASPDDLAAAMQTIKSGTSNLNDGDVLAAFKAYASVSPDLKKDPDVAKAAADLHDRLVNSTNKAFLVVNELKGSNDNVAAAVALKAMAKTLAGTDAESKAKSQLDELLAKPEVKEQLEGAERKANAAAALTVAKKLRDAGADESAYHKFKSITLDYPETPAATEAAEVVKTYDADSNFQLKLKDNATASKAKPALSMADSYAKNGMTAQAKQKYQEIIDEYPGTTYADNAKKALANLK